LQPELRDGTQLEDISEFAKKTVQDTIDKAYHPTIVVSIFSDLRNQSKKFYVILI
jgi:hypothetical protein